MVTVDEEPDDDGVADVEPVDWLLVEVALLLVELCEVVAWLDALAELLVEALVAMTATRPPNATPDRTAAVRRARAAGWRRRGPGRPVDDPRRGVPSDGGREGDVLIGAPRRWIVTPEHADPTQEPFQARSKVR